MRLFTGFRLTRSPDPYFDDIEESLNEMRPMKIKSGQRSAVYSDHSWSTPSQLPGLLEWTKTTLVDEATHQKQYVKSSRNPQLDGQWFTIPKGPHGTRNKNVIDPMPSLRNPNYSFLEDWVVEDTDDEFQRFYEENKESYMEYMYPVYEDDEKKLYKPQLIYRPQYRGDSSDPVVLSDDEDQPPSKRARTAAALLRKFDGDIEAAAKMLAKMNFH